MTEEKFSPEQSILLIQSMISKTKQEISDNSIYFLVFGWTAFTACVLQFVLKHYVKYERHYLVWFLIIIGIVFSFYQGRKEERSMRVRTYVSESIRHLWVGMAISFFVLSMILTLQGWATTIFPFFIMLYGLGTFVSGSIIRFRPLIIGGLIASALAIASTFVNYDFQMLFGALSILVSYIIPAHLMRTRKPQPPALAI